MAEAVSLLRMGSHRRMGLTAPSRLQVCRNRTCHLTQAQFIKPALVLVWNRDYYSLKTLGFSLNTLAGRVHVPFARRGMERFFDWQ